MNKRKRYANKKHRKNKDRLKRLKVESLQLKKPVRKVSKPKAEAEVKEESKPEKKKTVAKKAPAKKKTATKKAPAKKKAAAKK